MHPDIATVELVTGEGRFPASAAGPTDAPVVLLLHGFPQSRYTWRDCLPALADAGLRAVAPDQRGYCAGVRPTEIDAYRTDRLVADIVDMLDVLGAEQAHIVGHDWGGQLAWLTAAHHPERVRSLTVLSRPHPTAFARSFTLDAAQANRSGHHRTMGPETTDRLWADDRKALRTIFSNADLQPRDIDAYVATFADRAALDGAVNWYRAAAAPGGRGLATDCPTVAAPTLYLWGNADHTVGRTAAALTADFVTGTYRFVEIDGGGHFLTDDVGADIVIRELVVHTTSAPTTAPS